VSRILVADDNSNIQKMVALALKDEGIDVVAVGNGEAAMRKISDLHPDLVLADIFMPVRNGYEVCEFVKSDSRYMNTPVVLLVGAFDPLDEQETQRVRADGVLKKPFVPPDPLVNMVKALLAKSNGQKAQAVPAPIPPKAAMPPQATAPQTIPPPMAAEAASQPSPSSELAAAPADALRQPQNRIASTVVQAPAAFVPPSKQSEYQGKNAEDSDEVVTAVRDPNLGEPLWAAPEEPEETEEETETKPQDMLDMHSFGNDGPSVEGDDEPQPHFRPDSPLLDSNDFSAGPGVSANSQTEAAPVQQGSQPSAGEDFSDAAVTQYENVAPSSSSAPPEPSVEPFQFDPRLTFPVATQDASMESGSDQSAFAELTPLDSPAAATLSRPGANSISAKAPSAAVKPLDTHEQMQPIELDLPTLPDHEAVITAATEAARLAFSELNTLPGSGTSPENSDRSSAVTKQKDALPGAANQQTPPSPEMIEAVVSRLLERMQPQIMEVVNREVLRPAIEAIVRREMKKD
jgi:CheY-like chemotaxis protein